MNKIKEIDAFIISVLTFFFFYCLWSIDVSFGAIASGGTIITLSGIDNPYNFYHKNLIILIVIWFITLGYFLIKIHIGRSDYEQKRKHKTIS